MSEHDHQRAIDLLEANHVFPGVFPVAVIARNEPVVAAAVVAAAEEGLPAPLPATAHEVRTSAHGKYVSHRLAIWCEDAEHVLALFGRLRAVDGVVSVL